ncbi:MAG: TetR/AcrR family transcriptional regulator C-terminal domain-containing protein [Huintestinicola sp.]
MSSESYYDSHQPMKQRLAAELKKKMTEKPFDKITVRELTDGCNVNRQTFYYHFQDIYDLLQWTCHEEAVSVMRLQDSSVTWQESVMQLLKYITANKAFCTAILNSLGHRHLKRFFSDDFTSLIRKVISSCGIETENMPNDSNSHRELVEFSVKFYSLASASLLESWILGEISLSPDELVKYLEFIVFNNIRGLVAEKYMKDKKISAANETEES